MYENILEATLAIKSLWNRKPIAGIILGTGLGNLIKDIEVEEIIPYEKIPKFLTSSAPSHAGRLVCGLLSKVPVVVMDGRFHYYEGYSLQDVTFPVRVMKMLGSQVLAVTNASGCMNPMWKKGDIMLIEDHINMMSSPLVGPNDDRLGPRFPDMSQPYDKELMDVAVRKAYEHAIELRRGVFVAVAGPNLETKAEYRMLREAGADVVGMSTVPEIIVGVHSGMRNIGFSVVTDMCLPNCLEPAKIEDIIAAANSAEGNLRTLMREVIGCLPKA